MESILLVRDPWDMEIIRLIKQGLSDKSIAEQVPFRSDYVTNLRMSLKGVSVVQPNGV